NQHNAALCDHGRRMNTDLALYEINRLVVASGRKLFQVHNSVLAKRRDSSSSFCVKSNKLVTRRDVKDSFDSSVAPIRASTTGQLTRGGFSSCALVLAVHPEQLARRRIKRDDVATRTGCRVKDALDH